MRAFVLAGSTGVGKTALAVRIAPELPGGSEIISADSVALVRGMDVATAKPSAAQRQAVPHHLVDVTDVRSPWSVAEFVDAGRLALSDVRSRGRTPLIVGGTGYYLQWLLYYRGPPGTPELDQIELDETRLRLQAMGWVAAKAKLMERDSDYASSLTENDWYRLVRATAVLNKLPQAASLRQLMPERVPAEETKSQWRGVYLTRSNVAAYKRSLDRRCEVMVAEGLLIETAGLLRNGMDPATPTARAIGYRQAAAFLAQPRACWTNEALINLIFELQRATRRYAAKQNAWFRNKMPEFLWMDADAYTEDELKSEMLRVQDHHEDTWNHGLLAAESLRRHASEAAQSTRTNYRTELTFFADKHAQSHVLDQLRHYMEK